MPKYAPKEAGRSYMENAGHRGEGQKCSSEIRVAVIIPYYNGSRFIERSARSVLEQTVQPAEFLVVDDGSSPEEAACLDAFAEKMGFRVLHKENGGQGSARNAGVAACGAEHICFLDQDDFYLKNHIEILVSAMPKNDPHFGWVYGELFEADGDGNIVSTSIAGRHARHPKTNIEELLANDMFVLPSASLILRTAFEAVGGFDEQFIGYEDDDLFLRLFRAGFNNYFVARAVTVWCINTESTSYGIRMARSRLKYFKKLTASFPDDPVKEHFYIRDAVIPRFHNQIFTEAFAAASGRGGKFFTHRQEYIAIADEYTNLICSMPSLSPYFKAKVRLYMRLLAYSSGHPFYKIWLILCKARNIGQRIRRRLL
jgi:glycosyltransferase involved in cell wall biosynthesis